MMPAENSVLHGNYVRSALKLGLELDAKLGANPYKSGLIGGSDAHVGVVTVAGRQLLRRVRQRIAIAGSLEDPARHDRK